MVSRSIATGVLSRAVSMSQIIYADMLKHMIPESDLDKRVGGNLVIWNGTEVVPSLSTRIVTLAEGASREIDIEAFARFYKNSHEKASRLSARHSIGHKDISSWVSRDFNAKKYGGAVACTNHGLIFVSFSGFKEHDDEFFCTQLALRLNWMEKIEGQKILELSENPWLKVF